MGHDDSTEKRRPRSSSRDSKNAQKDKIRLVVAGACYLDTILSVPFFPAEDEKLRASSLVHRRGGNGPNTLEVLQQLMEGHGEKLSLSLCSVLPSATSLAAEQIRQSLGPHIDLSCCIYRPERTEAASSYIIRSLETGSRTIINYNGLPEMSIEEFRAAAEKVEEEACWFHFEGRIPETTLQCVQSLRTSQPEAKISVEVEKPGRRGLLEVAQEADVVFYSKDWAQHIAYQSAEECLEEQAKQLTKPFLQCCTWGRDGASIFDRRTGSIVHTPAFLPEGKEAVDTTGAGDTFIAAMLYCLMLCPDLNSQLMLRFANKLAGHKVAQEGFDELGQAALGDLPDAMKG